MDEQSARRTPAWTTIAAEQIRLVGLRFRVAGAALFAIGVLVSVAFVWFLRDMGSGFVATRTAALANHSLNAVVRAKMAAPLEPIPVVYAPEISTVVVALALLFALALWQDEPPTQRGYHLAMPVHAATHTLTRVLAGWLWMMVITTLFLAAFVSVPAIVGWLPGALPVHVSYMAWWEWLVPFTAVTLAYLFTSAASVGARRPFTWVGGTVIIYMGVITLLGMLHMQEAAATLRQAVSGFYGASAAMAGEVAWTAGTPSLSRWLGATAIWGLAGAALLFTVAHRRAER